MAEQDWQLASRAALGLSIQTAGIPCDLGPVNWTVNPPTVRLDFGSTATQAQKTQAANMAASWDWSQAAQAKRTAASQLGIPVAFPPKLLGALLLRASSQWLTLTVAERNTVQQIIDTAAGDVITALRT